MPRSELVVATGTYDGGPSAPTARSSVADGGFIKSRVALRPVRAAQSDAAPPSYATRSAPTSATIVASRRGDSSTHAAARAAIDASVTRRAQKKFCRALGPASPASKKGAAVVETKRS